MKIQTFQIIKNLVASLQVNFLISNASVDGDNFKLETECTWWLSINCDIVIDNKPYTIVSFLINDHIIVSGPSIPVVNSFAVPVPEFLNGTLKMAREEVTAEPDKELVFPLVYLKEIIKDDEEDDDESMIDREADLRLFFIASADTENWLTDDHYENVIDPMQSMVSLFKAKVKVNKLFVDNAKYNSLPLNNISVDEDQNKSLFDTNLSGIELRFFAQIREDLSCVSKCDCI